MATISFAPEEVDIVIKKHTEDTAGNTTSMKVEVTTITLPRALWDLLGHELCIGIRKGLYGADSGNNPSIIDAISDSMDVLTDRR